MHRHGITLTSQALVQRLPYRPATQELDKVAMTCCGKHLARFAEYLTAGHVGTQNVIVHYCTQCGHRTNTYTPFPIGHGEAL